MQEPRSMPKSRQSLAVKINGALTGTTPEATSLLIGFQHYLERAGRSALEIGGQDFDLHLAVGSLSLALILVRIIANKLYSYDSTPSSTYKVGPPDPAQCVDDAVGIGRHIDVNTNKVFFCCRARARRLRGILVIAPGNLHGYGGTRRSSGWRMANSIGRRRKASLCSW